MDKFDETTFFIIFFIKFETSSGQNLIKNVFITRVPHIDSASTVKVAQCIALGEFAV